MKLQYSIFLIFLFVVNQFQAQEISAKVIDSKTKAPVPFATIKTAENKGVISNDEGSFVVNANLVENGEIEISCMGYESKTFSLAELENKAVVSLDPAINQLETVFLSSNKPNVDSIIARVNRNYKTNYSLENLNYQFFQRQTSFADLEELEIEIDRASEFDKAQIKRSNAELASIADEMINSNSIGFEDYRGNLAIVDKDNSKLNIDKATEIFNSNQNFSIEDVQERAIDITLKYLDTTETYKLKTGWFKIEDSLSLLENRDKKKDTLNTIKTKNIKSNVISDIKDSYLGYESILRTILDQGIYNYQLENATFFNDELIYEISFEPRRSAAKFEGKLYISDASFAVLKLDYKYAKGKRGSKLNLRLVLGVKYIENLHQGSLIFRKSVTDSYVPRYIGSTTGQYVYVSRPLKFIENSEDRNKTSLSFKFEGQINEKYELLFESVTPLDTSAYETMVEPESVTYEKLRKYDADQWTGSETLAPTEELRKFEGGK